MSKILSDYMHADFFVNVMKCPVNSKRKNCSSFGETLGLTFVFES